MGRTDLALEVGGERGPAFYLSSDCQCVLVAASNSLRASSTNEDASADQPFGQRRPSSTSNRHRAIFGAALPLAAASAAAHACVALASSAPPLTVSGAVRCVARMALVLADDGRQSSQHALQRGCCTASEGVRLQRLSRPFNSRVCGPDAVVCLRNEPLLRSSLPLASLLCKRRPRGDPSFSRRVDNEREDVYSDGVCASCGGRGAACRYLLLVCCKNKTPRERAYLDFLGA